MNRPTVSGCPDLQHELFTAVTMEQLCDTETRAYVNHRPDVDRAGEGLRLSSIYDWFQIHFGASKKGGIAHLKCRARPATKAFRRSIAG